jgi:hypothetical protein
MYELTVMTLNHVSFKLLKNTLPGELLVDAISDRIERFLSTTGLMERPMRLLTMGRTISNKITITTF